MLKLKPVIEGKVYFQDKKKWKKRYCVLSRLTKVADHLELFVFKTEEEYHDKVSNSTMAPGSNANAVAPGTTPPSVIAADPPIATYVTSQENGPSQSVEKIYGCLAGLHLENRNFVMLLVCTENVQCLAFETFETMEKWAQIIKFNLKDENCFASLIKIGKRIQSPPLEGCLHVLGHRVCFVSGPGCTSGNLPKLVASWEIRDISVFGVINSKSPTSEKVYWDSNDDDGENGTVGNYCISGRHSNVKTKDRGAFYFNCADPESLDNYIKQVINDNKIVLPRAFTYLNNNNNSTSTYASQDVSIISSSYSRKVTNGSHQSSFTTCGSSPPGPESFYGTSRSPRKSQMDNQAFFPQSEKISRFASVGLSQSLNVSRPFDSSQSNSPNQDNYNSPKYGVDLPHSATSPQMGNDPESDKVFRTLPRSHTVNVWSNKPGYSTLTEHEEYDSVTWNPSSVSSPPGKPSTSQAVDLGAPMATVQPVTLGKPPTGRSGNSTRTNKTVYTTPLVSDVDTQLPVPSEIENDQGALSTKQYFQINSGDDPNVVPFPTDSARNFKRSQSLETSPVVFEHSVKLERNSANNSPVTTSTTKKGTDKSFKITMFNKLFSRQSKSQENLNNTDKSQNKDLDTYNKTMPHENDDSPPSTSNAERPSDHTLQCKGEVGRADLIKEAFTSKKQFSNDAPRSHMNPMFESDQSTWMSQSSLAELKASVDLVCEEDWPPMLSFGSQRRRSEAGTDYTLMTDLDWSERYQNKGLVQDGFRSHPHTHSSRVNKGYQYNQMGDQRANSKPIASHALQKKDASTDIGSDEEDYSSYDSSSDNNDSTMDGSDSITPLNPSVTGPPQTFSTKLHATTSPQIMNKKQMGVSSLLASRSRPSARSFQSSSSTTHLIPSNGSSTSTSVFGSPVLPHMGSPVPANPGVDFVDGMMPKSPGYSSNSPKTDAIITKQRFSPENQSRGDIGDQSSSLGGKLVFDNDNMNYDQEKQTHFSKRAVVNSYEPTQCDVPPAMTYYPYDWAMSNHVGGGFQNVCVVDSNTPTPMSFRRSTSSQLPPHDIWGPSVPISVRQLPREVTASYRHSTPVSTSELVDIQWNYFDDKKDDIDELDFNEDAMEGDYVSSQLEHSFRGNRLATWAGEHGRPQGLEKEDCVCSCHDTTENTRNGTLRVRQLNRRTRTTTIGSIADTEEKPDEAGPTIQSGSPPTSTNIMIKRSTSLHMNSKNPHQISNRFHPSLDMDSCGPSSDSCSKCGCSPPYSCSPPHRQMGFSDHIAGSAYPTGFSSIATGLHSGSSPPFTGPCSVTQRSKPRSSGEYMDKSMVVRRRSTSYTNSHPVRSLKAQYSEDFVDNNIHPKAVSQVEMPKTNNFVQSQPVSVNSYVNWGPDQQAFQQQTFQQPTFQQQTFQQQTFPQQTFPQQTFQQLQQQTLQPIPVSPPSQSIASTTQSQTIILPNAEKVTPAVAASYVNLIQYMDQSVPPPPSISTFTSATPQPTTSHVTIPTSAASNYYNLQPFTDFTSLNPSTPSVPPPSGVASHGPVTIPTASVANYYNLQPDGTPLQSNFASASPSVQLRQNNSFVHRRERTPQSTNVPNIPSNTHQNVNVLSQQPLNYAILVMSDGPRLSLRPPSTTTPSYSTVTHIPSPVLPPPSSTQPSSTSAQSSSSTRGIPSSSVQAIPVSRSHSKSSSVSFFNRHASPPKSHGFPSGSPPQRSASTKHDKPSTSADGSSGANPDLPNNYSIIDFDHTQALKYILPQTDDNISSRASSLSQVGYSNSTSSNNQMAKRSWSKPFRGLVGRKNSTKAFTGTTVEEV